MILIKTLETQANSIFLATVSWNLPDHLLIAFFNSHNPKQIKFITSLWFGLSHLKKHKFKHRFKNLLNLICNCSLDVESALHYLHRCRTYNTERYPVLSTIRKTRSH